MMKIFTFFLFLLLALNSYPQDNRVVSNCIFYPTSTNAVYYRLYFSVDNTNNFQPTIGQLIQFAPYVNNGNVGVSVLHDPNRLLYVTIRETDANGVPLGTWFRLILINTNLNEFRPSKVRGLKITI